ncbi:MAG: DNA replication and repair protein RecF [Verrucomicrobia bacterium]|nr:DNA replication and repair protein RecF [Verrucomicrobiota bacterium]MBV9299358.1 DNA replication and repair protein RecF [Verrucomicrobiota bacterium]MBV9642735.1 DNA replication and repair protein RecF [Verrucomicrobiota bacterium]
MVSKLSVRDFRCFSSLEIEFHPESTCIIGRNASGKTSLLEALAVLTRLQSPKANSLLQLIRIGAKGLVTDGFVSDYHLQFYYSASRRKLALDAVVQKSSNTYLDIAKVVYLANSDIGLIQGSSDARRRFLDFVGSQLFGNYREILRSYEKALHSRNHYLKMIPSRRREVNAYSKPLLQFGHQLTNLRAFLLERLEPPTIESFAAISDRNETLSLCYQSGATADFEKALRESEGEESRFRTTVVGPHRDDFQLYLNTKPAELFASEGQQRTVAIALKLAQSKVLELEFKKPPLLLLDDVFGELDPVRRNRLFSALPSRGQRVVTTTHLDWLDSLPAGKLYRIHESSPGDRILEKVT